MIVLLPLISSLLLLPTVGMTPPPHTHTHIHKIKFDPPLPNAKRKVVHTSAIKT
jgi:hypothetical protein